MQRSLNLIKKVVIRASQYQRDLLKQHELEVEKTAQQ